MIICNDCGHVFDESEWGDYGECPSCNSTDTEEARECPICGEWYYPFALEGHMTWCCPECFQKALTAENFLKYATSGAKYDEPDVLEDFIMYEVFDLDQELRFSSLSFKEHCHNIYQDLAKSGTVGDLIKDYFERVPDTYSDFTDWMVKVHNGESTKVV